MPDRELVLRERCEHGWTHRHATKAGNPWWTAETCPGGSETVLDLERWLRLYCRLTGKSILVKVQDVIGALGGSDE